MLLTTIFLLSTILVTIFKVKKPLNLAISLILSGFILITLISFVTANNDNLREVFYSIIFYIFITIFIIIHQRNNNNRSISGDQNSKNYSKIIIIIPAFIILAGMFFLINDSYNKFHPGKQATISEFQQNFYDKKNDEHITHKTKIDTKIADNKFFKISNEAIIISCLSFILLL